MQECKEKGLEMGGGGESYSWHGLQSLLVHVDEEGHVQHELADDRQEDVGAEDGGVGALLGQPLQGLAVADDEKHVGGEEALGCGLQVPHLHSLP